jgi:hypothetical protein
MTATAPSRPAPARFAAWFRRRLQLLQGLPFKWGISSGRHVYLAHHPDAQVTFAAHPEFAELFQRFIRHNRRNNAGDIPRLWSLILNCKQILAEGIPGDFAELGVWRGNTAAVLAHFAARDGRRVFLFDTYEGFDSRDLAGIDADKGKSFTGTSVDLVRQTVGDDAHCDYVKGHFPMSLREEHHARRYAVVSLDCDLYAPMRAGLEFFYPRMPPGGMLFLHDYASQHWNGAKQAIDEFCRASGEHLILMPDKSGSAFVRKSG